ncbi:conserved hypothetical protein [Leishmania mexicana MHOM/GT/2001/U1103]|uniref:Uncharacterized protein n=1 Tax=Leishmania mexicana (strain MHOM/GT/2001/U1103) TaxID=929439 RepID=E9AY39_LEIMU|nr:conserved hypothetical protein [Leishmania mexicana MHOM/GT/2001/U1103]CBZ27880.1 conserved hypothetical protein [Leishmania mexicana MHOM/GT/2001/U1103]
MASTSGPASLEEAALASLGNYSPEQLQMAETALRAVLMEKVQALAAAHGDAFIQGLVQKEIARTKKMETELASMKKRLGVQERFVDSVRMDVRKVKAQEEKSKYICQNLQETARKREQLTEKMQPEMEAYRSDVRERVSQNVQSIWAECEKRRERVETVEAEVKELEARLGHRKETFEQNFAEFQDGLKGRTTEYQELIVAYQEATKDVGLIEAQLMLVRRERQSVEVTRAALQQQLEVYEKQFEGFADSVMKPEDVEALARRQHDQAQMRITELEAEKANVHQQRLQMDKELTDLRAKHASLKREMQQLERAKAAAEKKCRQAQQTRQAKK